MNQALLTKKVAVVEPVAIVNNASVTSVAIDTLGWDYCEIIAMLGATDIALTALKVQESDTNGSFADVVGLRFGTDANDAGSTSVLPSATDDNKLFGFCIDLRPRKRYLNLVATFGNGSQGGFLAALAELSRGAQSPKTAAEAGYSQRLVL